MPPRHQSTDGRLKFPALQAKASAHGGTWAEAIDNTWTRWGHLRGWGPGSNG